MRQPKARSPKKPAPLSRAALEQAALRYLNRFDASAAKLRKVLAERVRHATQEEPERRSEAAQWIAELIDRYRDSGLLNDERYATALAESLRRRGASGKQIVHKLRARGLEGELIEGVLRADRAGNPDAELEAARRFVQKRRLGPHRPEAERAAKRSRDLSALARAGFSYELARRVLGPGDDDGAF